MKCPRCNAWAEVLQSREHKFTNTRSRRYQCGNLHRFSTLEVLAPSTVGGGWVKWRESLLRFLSNK